MGRHSKDTLREVVPFLVALAIALVALFIMAIVLGYIWHKVPVPPIDNGQ